MPTLLGEGEGNTATLRYSEWRSWFSGVVRPGACTDVFYAEPGRSCVAWLVFSHRVGEA